MKLLLGRPDEQQEYSDNHHDHTQSAEKHAELTELIEAGSRKVQQNCSDNQYYQTEEFFC